MKTSHSHESKAETLLPKENSFAVVFSTWLKVLLMPEIKLK